jgi:hypothetical protein
MKMKMPRCACEIAASVMGTALWLCAGRANAGPPFITDDPEPVELHNWEVYGFTAGAHQHGNTSGVLPGLEVNYGAAPEAFRSTL